ncbi:hypothetical protein Tco_0431872 [Tanacetum coccineum]
MENKAKRSGIQTVISNKTWIPGNLHKPIKNGLNIEGISSIASEAERADKDEAEIEADTNASTETSNGSEADQDYD